MSNVNKILVVLIVALVLTLVGIVVWRGWGGETTYHAVSLKTGELYFGKLSFFPSMKLKNVYLLQVNQQNQQSPLSVQKLSNVFWGPEDYLKINKDEVVWVTKLRADSQLAQLIKGNPDLTPQPGAEQQIPQQQPPSSGQPSDKKP